MNLHISLIHLIFLAIFGIAALICLVFGIRQFMAIKFPLQRSEQVKRAVIVAVWSSIAFLFLIALSGVLIWADTGVFKSMILVFPLLCFIPFVFLISAFGSYIQSSWYARLNKYRENTITKIGERYEK